jgi:hypothetical protein
LRLGVGVGVGGGGGGGVEKKPANLGPGVDLVKQGVVLVDGDHQAAAV